MEQVGKGMTRFKMAEEEKSLICLLKHMGITGLRRTSKKVLNNIFDLNIVCVGMCRCQGSQKILVPLE